MATAKITIAADNQTHSGIEAAKNDLHGFGDVANELKKTLIQAFAADKIFEGIKELGKQAMECVKDFGTWQRTMLQLKAAFGDNEIGFKRMNVLIDDMAKKTLEPKDAIEKLVAEMADLYGPENTQKIEDTMRATIALSNVTGKDLASAFQMVNATYSGTAGKLDKLIPEMGNLTKAQLEAGGAATILNQKLTASSDAMAGGVAQEMNNLTKSFDEMKEKIGKPLAEVAVRVVNAIKPIVDKITVWLEEHSNQIANFFIKLPEIASQSFMAIEASAEYLFTFDNIKNRIINAFKWALLVAVDSLKLLGDLVAALAKTIWEPIKFAFENIFYGIKASFVGFINGIISAINQIPGVKIGLVNASIIGKQPEGLGDKEKTVWTDFGKQVANLGLDIKDGIVDLATSLPKEMDNAMKPYLDNIQKLIDSIGGTSYSDLTLPQGSSTTPLEGAGGGSSAFTGFGNLEGLSTILAPLKEAFGPLVSVIQPVLDMFTSANPLIAVLLPIIQGFVSIVGPAISTVIKPFMDALSTIGQLLGKAILPILDALAPIFSIVAQILIMVLTPLINQLAPVIQIIASILTLVLTPILKTVATVFEILCAPIQFVGDLFKWVGDILKTFVHNITHPFNTDSYSAFSSDAFSGLADRIKQIWNTDYNTNTADGSVVNGSTSSGGSASYTGGNNTYILNINAPVYGPGGEQQLFADFVVFQKTQGYFNYA